ncbi:hypothetical protein [Nocardioides sp.]
MADPKRKTQPTTGDVAEFLDSVENPRRREDARDMVDLMRSSV